MTILLLVALGISFLCAVTLIGACVVSGQSQQNDEEFGKVQEDDEWQRVNPSTSPLTTTPSSFS